MRPRTRASVRLALLGIREQEIATRCGVVQSAVSHWITGRAVPGDRRKVTLRDAYGIPVEEWLTPYQAQPADY